MPWSIDKNHPECRGRFAVINSDTGEMVYCHRTSSSAVNHLRALWANYKPQITKEAPADKPKPDA